MFELSYLRFQEHILEGQGRWGKYVTGATIWEDRIIIEIKFFLSVFRVFIVVCWMPLVGHQRQWCMINDVIWIGINELSLTFLCHCLKVSQRSDEEKLQIVESNWRIFSCHCCVITWNFSENVWEAASLKVFEPARNAASVGGSQTTELRPIPAALPFSRHWAGQVRSWLRKWSI